MYSKNMWKRLSHPGVWLGALGLLSVPHLAAQRPSFRSAIDLVLLTVSVVGPGGRQAADLAVDDFEILEDGLPQEITHFSPADVPLSVALLVDTSASMDDQMPLAQKAAKDFIAKLRPGDVAQVVDFDSRVEVLQPLTGDRALLAAAIDRMRAGGSTALYNAVYIAVRDLEKARPQTADEIRRQVIVVLSDGEDTSSLVTFDDLLEVVKRSQTVIYPVGLGLEDASNGRRSDSEFALRQLARETGGRLFMAKQGTELADVYSQIANELTTQYVLGYLSLGQSNGAWRRLSVRVRRPNLQARTRSGYYAP
jgi:Ca-activated chloride channel family protein